METFFVFAFSRSVPACLSFWVRRFDFLVTAPFAIELADDVEPAALVCTKFDPVVGVLSVEVVCRLRDKAERVSWLGPLLCTDVRLVGFDRDEEETACDDDTGR
jgi:hypothetical protein